LPDQHAVAATAGSPVDRAFPPVSSRARAAPASAPYRIRRPKCGNDRPAAV